MILQLYTHVQSRRYDFKHIFDSENTHYHIPDISLRYIDIAVAKSLLPLEGKRIMVARQVASGKNPFGAWNQLLFKRYVFEHLINGPIVMP